MGMCGARTIREFQEAEMVVAPSIKTEGKQIPIAVRRQIPSIVSSTSATDKR